MDEPVPPSALEEHVEHGPRGARDPPALLRDDRAQEVLGEVPVARGDHVAQAIEEARLVGRGHAGLEQAVAEDEPAHAGGAADRGQPAVPHHGVDGVRRVVVGAADHRLKARPRGAVDGDPGAQVGGEQHRLHEAGRGRAPCHVPAAQAAGRVHHRERHVAAALRGEPDRGLHPGGARRDRRRRLRDGRRRRNGG